MPVDYGSTGAQRFAVAPAAGVAGATYFNTALSRLFISDGASWNLIGYDLSSMPQAWTKESVICATTANITLSGTVSVDGISPSAGQRVLVKDQTLPAENGIYVAAAGAWTRALDAQLSSQLAAAAVGVDNGTVNAGTVWYTTFNTSSVLGTTAMTWTKLGAGGGAPTGSAGGDLTGTYPNPTLVAPVPVTKGGTGSTAALLPGGLKYASLTTQEATTAVGTAGQLMLSGGTGAPTWANADLTALPGSWVKESVRVASVANLTLTGTQTVDGVALVVADRVLVKDQALPAQNGIYLVAGGAWTRPPGGDTAADIAGAITSVDVGTVNGGSTWTTSFRTTDTINTTGMVWSKIPTNGENWLAPVRVVTPVGLGNITLSGLQTIDGVALVAGDRVLCRDQSAAAANGVYVVAAGAWVRAADADTAAKVTINTRVRVTEGTQQKDTTFVQGLAITAIGVDSQEWKVRTYTQVGGLFNFPNYKSVGQTYYNLNQRAISIWDGVRWNYSMANVWQCTSSSRPTFVEDGAVIYETDTGLSYILIGQVWVPYGSSEVAVQTAQPTDLGLDLWVDTDDYGTAVTAGPLGTMGFAEITANSANTSASATAVDIAGLAVTFTALAGRRYRVKMLGGMQSTIAGDRGAVLLREGSTQLQAANINIVAATQTTPCFCEVYLTPTAGAHTYKVSILRSNGTGTITLLAATGTPAQLIVEDIGV